MHFYFWECFKGPVICMPLYGKNSKTKFVYIYMAYDKPQYMLCQLFVVITKLYQGGYTLQTKFNGKMYTISTNWLNNQYYRFS